jgi:hypothetical protein
MQLDVPMRTVTTYVDGEVLQALALVEQSFSARALHRLLGRYSEVGVRHAPNRLAEQGVVTVQRAGQAKLYELNRRHLAAPYVEGLARLKAELVSRLIQVIGTWEIPPHFAGLFGSAVDGEMRPESDIDIFIAREDEVDGEDDSWQRQISELTSAVTAWTGNDSRVLEMTASETRRALNDKDSVVATIRDRGRTLYRTDPPTAPPSWRAARTNALPRPSPAGRRGRSPSLRLRETWRHLQMMTLRSMRTAGSTSTQQFPPRR